MLSFLKSSQASYWGTTALVVVASAIVGREAAHGMDATQWLCSAFAILGSVSAAVMVRVWPEPQKIDD
jgi:hypothetical protein